MKITPDMAEMITPEIAKKMLLKNTKNRPFKESAIATYSSKLRDGKWKLNGDSIKFSSSGILLDGQNRLQACINTGISFIVFIVTGLDENVFDTLDVGKTRTASDILFIGTSDGDEVKSRVQLAAVIRYCEFYFNGTFNIFHNTRLSASAQDVLEKHIEDNGYYESLMFCRDTEEVMSRSQIAALHYIFSKIDKNLANHFINRIINGVGLSTLDPEYRFRKLAIKEKNSKKKQPRFWLFGLCIKAWNMKRTGQMSMLRIAIDEKFPTAK